MRFIKYILIFSCFLSIGQTITLNEKLAFPDAHGFGITATGGYGGNIIEVTNLNASGSGSLKSALETNGSRIVIFRVGGTIDMGGSTLYISDPNITIAGETAPGGGILIKNSTLAISTSNVILRHIRIRGSTSGDDIIRIKAFNDNLQNIIIDHCSISWGQDEILSITVGSGSGSVRNVTVQNTILSEAIGSGYAVLVMDDVKDVSFYKNLLAHNKDRQFHSSSCGTDYEIINNLIYGYQRATELTYEGIYDVIGNTYKASSNTSPTTWALRYQRNDFNCPGANPALGKIHQSDNATFGSSYPLLHSEWNTYQSPNRVTIGSKITPMPRIGVEAELLPHVGNSLNSDSVDNRIISDYINGTGGLITSPDQVGGYPTIANGTPYPDSNNDGISDTWASTHDISSASQVKSTYTIGGKTIINDAGYTALEIFLAELAGDFDRLPLDSPSGVPVITLLGSNPMHLQVGQPYDEPGATATNTSNSVIITGTVNTSEAGTYYRYYNVSNEAGAAEQKVRTIIVSDNPPSPTLSGKGFNRNILLTLD